MSDSKAMRWLPLAIFAALAVLLAAGVWLSRKPDREALPSPLIGKPAPAFSLPVLHEPGRLVTLADLKGAPFVLNVWGSWCASCRDEHPVLTRFAETKRVRVVGYNWKDERADALRWLRAVRQSVLAGAGRLRQPLRARLGHLRRAGNLPGRRRRHRALEARRPADATTSSSDELLPAARAGGAGAMMRWLARAAAVRRAGRRDGAGDGRSFAAALPRRRRGNPLPRAGHRTALRHVPEPVAGRFQRADRARPAPRSAGADAAGQERRADPGLPGRALWRIRAVQAADRSHDLAAVVRPGAAAAGWRVRGRARRAQASTAAGTVPTDDSQEW